MVEYQQSLTDGVVDAVAQNVPERTQTSMLGRSQVLVIGLAYFFFNNKGYYNKPWTNEQPNLRYCVYESLKVNYIWFSFYIDNPYLYYNFIEFNIICSI